MFLTVGNITLDLFVSGLDKMPALGGDEFTVDNLAFCDQPLTMVLGGNGTISAYVLARLGAPVAVGGAIGLDGPGEIMHGWLTQAQVRTEGLARSATHATATTTIITDRALNRVSFYHPGANLAFKPEDLPSEVIEQADVILLASFALLTAWRPHGFAQVLRKGASAGAVTALDIGPAIAPQGLPPPQLAELRPMLPDVHYFICNAHELAVCTGADQIEEGASQILAAGARCAVIKRGRQGAVVYEAGREAAAVPGFAVEARFTVGAGDSFNAGFLYGIHQGWNALRATRFANAVAALVVSGARGALGAPTLEQVMDMLFLAA
jgi:sugar/nucleoside kinase (ribokinase family)